MADSRFDVGWCHFRRIMGSTRISLIYDYMSKLRRSRDWPTTAKKNFCSRYEKVGLPFEMRRRTHGIPLSVETYASYLQ